jgi:hypothetical protein
MAKKQTGKQPMKLKAKKLEKTKTLTVALKTIA